MQDPEMAQTLRNLLRKYLSAEEIRQICLSQGLQDDDIPQVLEILEHWRPKPSARDLLSIASRFEDHPRREGLALAASRIAAILAERSATYRTGR